MAKYDLGELVFKITGDNSGFKKPMDDAKKSATGFTNVLKSVAAVVSSMGLVSFFSRASKAASDAEETTSKFNVVFSKIRPLADQTAESLSKAYGLAITETKALLSGTGNLLQGFGMTQEASLAVSDVVQRLSADLVSMTNYSGGVRGASEALTKALLGETEQAKSLGLAIGDEQLRNFGLRLGQDTEKMTLQEKAMLRIKLAVEQSKNALGDYAGTSESFANSMRRLDQRLTGIMESVGKEINPEIGKLARLFLISSESGGFLSDALKGITKAAVLAIKGFAILTTSIERYYQSQKQAAFTNLNDEIKTRNVLLLEEARSNGLVATSTLRNGYASKDYSKAVEELRKAKDSGNKKAIEYWNTLKKNQQAMLDNANASNTSVQRQNELIDLSDELSNKTKKDTDSQQARNKSIAEFNKKLDEANRIVAKNPAKAIDKDQLKLVQSTKDMANAWGQSSPQLKTFISKLNGKDENSLKSALDDLEGLPPQISSAIVNMSKISGSTLTEITDKMKKGLSIQDDVVLWGKLSPEIKEAITQIDVFINKYPELADQLITDKSLFDEMFKSGQKFSELDFSAKVTQINSAVQGIASGITGLMSAMISLNEAQLQATLDSLDAEQQARLEAAGVAEETAIERAQAEYDAAVLSGDAITIAEKDKALKKAKIEDEFAKKKAKAEYDAALRSWELQKQIAMIQMFTAPLNAYVSSLTAPWPLNMILAPINAALAFATAGLQYKAVAEAKPQAPKFATGGIVPGTSYAGDKVTAQVNSAEMVLDQEQQGRLFAIANGAGGNNMKIYQAPQISDESILDFIFKASKDGRLLVADRAIQAV